MSTTMSTAMTPICLQLLIFLTTSCILCIDAETRAMTPSVSRSTRSSSPSWSCTRRKVCYTNDTPKVCVVVCCAACSFS
jgi:hypothetical protein